MNVRHRMLGSLALVAVLAGGCAGATTTSGGSAAGGGSAGTAPAQPMTGGRINFAVDGEPEGFDPGGSQYLMNVYLVAGSMLEPLAAFDAEGAPKPFLAESFTPTDLAALWTVKLRSGITFQDGTRFDAAAVKANLDAARSGIGAVTLSVIDDVRVKDDLTVDVAMKQPWASFPAIMTTQVGLMASPKTLKTPQAVSDPVGTGPFKFDHWNRGSSLTVKRNPNYWQAGRPYLDEIEFRFVSDPATRSAALESGDADMILTNSTATMVAFRDRPGYKSVVDDDGDTQNVLMNMAVAPFDNINARRALVLSTDSQAVIDTIGNGMLRPADQPFTERSPNHQSDPHDAKPDVEAAKAAVAQYTEETGKPLAFTYTTISDGTDLQIAQQLQSMWSAAGMEVKIDALEQATFATTNLTGKFQAASSPNFGFPDADWDYIFWHSSYVGEPGSISINFSHLSDPDIDAALKDGRGSLYPPVRIEAYKKIARLLNEKYVYAWLYRSAWAMIASDRVEGLDAPAKAGYARIDAKTWWPDVWLRQ